MRTSVLVTLFLSLAACSKNESAQAPAAQGAPASTPVSSTPTPVSPVAEAKADLAVKPSLTPASTAAPAPVLVAAAVSDPAPTAAPTPPVAPSAPARPDPTTNAHASVWDTLNKAVNRATNLAAGVALPASTAAAPASAASPGGVTVADLSSDQVTRGLKEALAKGLDHAIGQLGKDGGFLTNLNVRIPMPEKLQALEKLLRRTGQDKLVDDFVTTMNHAAERAVPVAAGVFTDGLKQMTVSDAQGILQGPKDAATQYFRRTTGPQIQEKFRPIVAQATTESGATAAYKNLLDHVGFASAFLKKESLDLDDYVTGKATDGLFIMVAEEEKKIRENPVARTTDLLKSVFGSLRK